MLQGILRYIRPKPAERPVLKRQAESGYGVILLIAFITSAVLVATSTSLMLGPNSGPYLGSISQDDIAAKQIAEEALDAAQSDILTKQAAGTAITTSYRYPSSSTNSITMPTYPGSGSSLTKGTYYVTATYARGYTFLLQATVAVGSNTVSVSRLVQLNNPPAPSCSRPSDIVFYPRGSSDEFGLMVGSQIGDVNNDGISDFIMTADNANGSGTLRGEVYLVFGRCSGWSSFYDSNANFTLSNSSTAKGTVRFMGRVDSYYLGYAYGLQYNSGDFNGDGIDDLLIGSGYGGESYIIFGRSQSGWNSLVDASGNLDLSISGKISQTNDMIRFKGASANNVGDSITSAGDVNNDGFDDILIGSAPGSNKGFAYLVFGRSMTGWDAISASDGSINLTTAGVVGETNDIILFRGESGSDFGHSINAAGDVDNDGYEDLIIGAPATGSGYGTTYLAMGRNMAGWDALSDDTTGVIDFVTQTSVANKLLLFNGNADYANLDISNAGDVDNDGYDDLLIGSEYDTTTGSQDGAVYLIFGRPWTGTSAVDWDELAPSTGIMPLLTKTTEANRIVMFTTNTSKGRLGSLVRAAGDANGDGYADIMFVQDDGCCSGLSDYIVVFGRSKTNWDALTGTNGQFSLDNISEANDMIRFGVQAASEYPSTIGSGDFNNDGYSDLIFGSYQAGTAGEVYVIFGRSMTNWDAITNTSGYYALTGLDP